MSSGWYGGQVHPQQFFNPGTINVYYNTYNAGRDISPARTLDSESEDDERELQPQYSPIPSAQPFLSAWSVSDRYTEIQIGVQSNPAFQPPIPPCDDCKSRRRNGQRPIVYTCFDCIPFKARNLCRNCAEKELSNDDCFHKPNHQVRKWQPSWSWNLSDGFRIPLPSKEMEDFVDNDLNDDLRAGVFESSRRYDYRAIRVIVPAPLGLCRISVKLEVEPYESVKRDLDIIDRLKGLLSSDKDDVFGTIGASAYPSTLQLPLRLRDPHAEPEELPKKGQLKLTDNVDLKRGDDFGKVRTLEVYANPGERGAIEVVLKDEYYRSEKYRSRPFTWKLKSISVTHVPPIAPSFASLAQMERYKRRRVQELKESHEKDRNGIKQHFEETQQRAENYREWQEGVEKREARKRDRSGVPQGTEEQRPSSMPPGSSWATDIPLLLTNTIGGRGRSGQSNRNGKLAARQDDRGRALLSPLDAISGARAGLPGRSVSPNWRANNPTSHGGLGRSRMNSPRTGGLSPAHLSVPSRGGSNLGRSSSTAGRGSSGRRQAPSRSPAARPMRLRR